MRDETTSARIPSAGGLSEEQRLSRICELLSKAVVADWTEQIVRAGPTNRPAAGEDLPKVEATDRQRIVSYLALVGGHATPSLIRATQIGRAHV